MLSPISFLGRFHALLLVLAPVGLAALCPAILDRHAARTTLDLGQHRGALNAHITLRPVCGPMLQLAIGVAIPRTVASITLAHVLVDRSALVAHAVVVAHIDHVAIALLSQLAGQCKALGNLNSALVLVTIHMLVDGEHLLISRDGLLILLEVAEQHSEVVQGGCCRAECMRAQQTPFSTQQPRSIRAAPGGK